MTNLHGSTSQLNIRNLNSHNYCHFLVCPSMRRFSIWIGKWVILLVVIGPQVSSSATWSDRYEIACATVISLWATAAVLASFAYPTPEQPTPSFGDHTCFNGVAFGIVSFQHNCSDIMSLVTIFLFLQFKSSKTLGYYYVY